MCPWKSAIVTHECGNVLCVGKGRDKAREDNWGALFSGRGFIEIRRRAITLPLMEKEFQVNGELPPLKAYSKRKKNFWNKKARGKFLRGRDLLARGNGAKDIRDEG